MSKPYNKKSNKKKGSAKKPKQQKQMMQKKAAGAFAGSSVRLSQCMIVKNEEKNIRQALSWGKDVVWEQIVVDTGSTDRTVEIAEEMGAKVCHFQWIDDFSAAKNYAIEQASGDWIAFLDADEYFPPEDVKKLMKLLAQAHEDLRVDVVTARMAHVNGAGQVTGTSPQQRIFRNGQKVRYQHRIHESLYGVNGAHVAAYDAQDQLLIIHTGYEQGDGDAAKGLRNISLLKKDLEDAPNDGMRLMYLADAYVGASMEREALEIYGRILWDPAVDTTDPLVVARSGFQTMDLRRNDPLHETEADFRRIRDRIYEAGWGDHPDADYYMGLWHIMSGDLMEAASLFESALEKMELYRGAEVVRMLSNIQVPYWVTAADALSKGNLQKAVSRAVDCLRVDKYNGDGIHILIKAFQFEHQSQGAGAGGRAASQGAGMAGGGSEPLGAADAGGAAPYRDFLFKLYDAGNLKDVLFLHKFAKEAGFGALDALICQALPPEVRGQV